MILFVRSTRSSTSCKLSITPWRSENLKNGTVFFSKQDKQGSVIQIVFVLLLLLLLLLLWWLPKPNCGNLTWRYATHSMQQIYIIFYGSNEIKRLVPILDANIPVTAISWFQRDLLLCINVYIYINFLHTGQHGEGCSEWYTSTERVDSRVHPIPQLNGNHY